MKVIDLLDKIAKGEQPPKKIIYNDKIYNYKTNDYFDDRNEYLSSMICFDNADLNDEVEIILDNKLEKFTDYELKHSMVDEYVLGIKINEIIDKINEIGGKNNE